MRKSPYQLIGGEAGVEQLVKTFYDIVESDPMGESLMAMHNRGHGIAHAREAQFEFLSGFLGIDLNESRNAEHAPVISAPASRATVRVIRTDEELMIAR